MLIITVESPKIDSPKMGFVFLNNLNSDVVSKNDLLCFKIKGLTFLLSKEWELKGKNYFAEVKSKEEDTVALCPIV